MKKNLSLISVLILSVVIAFSQENRQHDNHSHQVSVKNQIYLQNKFNFIYADLSKLNKNNFGVDNKLWREYIQKAGVLLEKVDEESFLSYVFLTNDADFLDIPYFTAYYEADIIKDQQQLIYKIGKGEITSKNIKSHFTGLQPKLKSQLLDFKKNRDQIIAQYNTLRGGTNGAGDVHPTACGQPCTNPGFEAGTGFWDYATGTSSSSALPPINIVPGFSPTQHFLKTAGGFDVMAGGTNLPQVAPGGGNRSLMLGDSTQVLSRAAFASISFDVTAATSNFTYRYAVVLQEPGVSSGHGTNDRPAFRVQMRDQNDSIIQCGNYEVVIQVPYTGFLNGISSDCYYRPWTTITVPLTAYIGQCITLEFYTKDCAYGGHYGYAYIDADCNAIGTPTDTIVSCVTPVTLTANPGAVHYAWVNTSAGGTVGIVGVDTNQTAVVNQGGLYEVTMTSAAGPTCVTKYNYYVVISPPPTAAFTNTTVCVGNATAFTDGSSPSSITSRYWDFNGDGVTDDTTQSPSYIYAAAGTYNVSLIVSSGGCNDTITHQVIVHPVANINAGPDQKICAGSTITLAAIFGGAATNGTWTGGTGTYAPNNTTPSAVYTPSTAEIAAGTVTLTFTTNAPSGPCVTNVDQMVITIDQLATVNAGTPQSICSGNTITLAGVIGGSATGATWTGGTGTYAPNNTTLNAVYTPSAAEFAAGSVTLTLTTTNGTSLCPPVTSSVTHNVFENPVPDFTVDVPKGCPVHCVNFSDLSTVGGISTISQWSWNFGDPTSGVNNTSSLQNPSHCYANTGYYTVTLTVTTSNGCVGTKTIPQMIQVYAIPTAEFNATPNPVSSFNPTVFFIDQSSSDVVYWNWNYGDGNVHPDNITANPSHPYPGTMDVSYMVTLIVHNADGCWDTVQHPVTVGPEFTFFIANAFTPNYDGINDDFNGKGVGIVDYDIWIFDRWGNMIFHTDQPYPYDAWDGKANYGKEIAQQDVYVWKVKLTDIFGRKHKYIGTVTLVK